MPDRRTAQKTPVRTNLLSGPTVSMKAWLHRHQRIWVDGHIPECFPPSRHMPDHSHSTCLLHNTCNHRHKSSRAGATAALERPKRASWPVQRAQAGHQAQPTPFSRLVLNTKAQSARSHEGCFGAAGAWGGEQASLVRSSHEQSTREHDRSLSVCLSGPV